MVTFLRMGFVVAGLSFAPWVLADGPASGEGQKPAESPGEKAPSKPIDKPAEKPAQKPAEPAEQVPEGTLFVLERNKNANFVRYEAKLTKSGTFDPDEPVIAYWIMAAEDRRREPLTMLEKQLAYGFSARPDKKGNVWLSLVAHKDKPIRIFKDDTGVHAEVGIAGKRAHLKRMFVQAGPEFIPKVIFLDLHGVDVKTGAPLYERITPKN